MLEGVMLQKIDYLTQQLIIINCRANYKRENKWHFDKETIN